MTKPFAMLFSMALAVGSPLYIAQQEKNPNQQQQQTEPKNQPPPDNPSQNTPSPSNPDIPKEKPGTNNPDISPDSKPAEGTTAPESKGKKGRRKKHTSSSTHTAPTE
jgi:hypothetical protein